jgi:CHAD domain-containing protein
MATTVALPAPGVQPVATMEATGRQAIAGAVRRLREHAAAARPDADPEHVHQIRVGLRRLGVAISLFAPYLGAGRQRRLVRRARRLRRELGATRDLDTAIAAAEARGERLARRRRAGLEALAQRWRADREAAHASALEVLAGRRFAVLLERVGGLLESRRAGDPPALLVNHAPAAILAAYAAIADQAAAGPTPEVAPLHRLRLRVKRLRYTIELLTPGLPADSSPLLHRLRAAQDSLGRLSDTAFCRELLGATLAATRGLPLASGELVEVIAFLREREAAQVRLARSGARAARPLLAPGFRRALRSLAAGIGGPG